MSSKCDGNGPANGDQCPNNNEDDELFLCILHFNDCYNVETNDQEPICGGAARFVTALHQFDHLDPLVLFSGDILAPSIMSSFTKGEQMLPVLERCNVHCALYGNHEFDFGLECLISFAQRCNFPWLMSNVLYKPTKTPLGEGKIKHIIQKGSIKIGLIGLIEEEWLSTLVLEESDIEYIDFVSEGRKLAIELREKDNVDLVIALTHMRTHNDIKLAKNVDEIDLILGGHDHVYDVRKINNKFVIKSGTDFRQFSKINIVVDPKHEPKRIVDIQVEENNVTRDIAEDPYLLVELEKYKTELETKMENVIAILDCDLDCRFSMVRTRETNSGNLITDVMMNAVPEADCALLNSGTLRSDRIHPKGAFKMRDLVNILPYMESLLVIEVTGLQLHQALENGVSQHPRFEGRFPQVSGIRFQFDSSKPPGQRVDRHTIQVQGEPLKEDRVYRMVTKEFIAQGKDGYMLKECPVYLNTEECLTMLQAFQEFLEITRLNQINKLNINNNCQKNRKLRRESLKMINQNINNSEQSKFAGDYVCHLNPKLEGRIINTNE